MRYFISGHRDLTIKEFEEHYVPQILKVLRFDRTPLFLVGDWEGCDEMFFMFIHAYKVPVVVHYVNKCRIDIENIKDKLGDWFEAIVGTEKCNTYDECDASMTRDSDFDIAWIRPGREDSHTAKNIKRRYNLC